MNSQFRKLLLYSYYYIFSQLRMKYGILTVGNFYEEIVYTDKLLIQLLLKFHITELSRNHRK